MLLDKLYNFYFSIPVLGKSLLILRIQRRFYEKLFTGVINSFGLKALEKSSNSLNKSYRPNKIIVSLSTIPERIDIVWISIETIFRQTISPDEIILWIDEKRFKDYSFPDSLKRQMGRGLQIRLCEDLKPHTKYYHVLKEFPGDIIITVDDDVIYPQDTISNLLDLHNQNPTAICANRVHHIQIKDNQILPYRLWIPNYKGKNNFSHLLVQTGVGGVLYPPCCLDEEVFNKSVFTEICSHADDIWLKCMALKKNTLVCFHHKFNKDLISVVSSQKVKLSANNVFNNGNDKQLMAVITKYDLSSKLLGVN